MSKPDLSFWSREESYDFWDAAWLCCDLEPEHHDLDRLPPKVKAMGLRLKREVSHSTRLRPRLNSIDINTGRPTGVTVTKESRFTRSALLVWAEESGERPGFLVTDTLEHNPEPEEVFEPGTLTKQEIREQCLREYLEELHANDDWEDLPVYSQTLYANLCKRYPTEFSTKTGHKISYHTFTDNFWKDQHIADIRRGYKK